jgi:hypothetical protein
MSHRERPLARANITVGSWICLKLRGFIPDLKPPSTVLVIGCL